MLSLFMSHLYVYAFLSAVICLAVRLFMKPYRGKFARDILMTVFAAYLATILAVLLCPSRLFIYGFAPWDWLDFSEWSWHFSLSPQQWNTSWELTLSIDYLRLHRWKIAALMPFGTLVPLLWGKLKWKTPALGLYMIVLSEVWQMLIGRVLDSNDILVEWIGVLGGFCVYELLSMLFPDGVKVFARPEKETSPRKGE